MLRSKRRFIMAANLLAAAGVVRARGPNCIRTKATSDALEDHHRTYRLSSADMRILTDEFHYHRVQEHPNCYYGTSEKMIEAFIAYLSSGGYYRQTARSEGIAKPTMIMYSRKVASFFRSTAANHIHLPIDEEVHAMRARHLGNSMVVGLVDGFLLKIQRPDRARDEFYTGRPGKCYDSMNVQYVCDLHGKILHVVTGISGRAHDKNGIEWSPRLRAWLDNLPGNYCILGDSAYLGYHPKCLALYRNPQGAQQTEFNRRGSSIRTKVENVIGAQECIWRLLMTKENRVPAKKGLEFPCDLVLTAAVLHNRFSNYLV